LLAVLAGDADELIAQRAAGALLSQPLDAVLAALAQADASQQLFRYCARNLVHKPRIADALAKNFWFQQRGISPPWLRKP
jgi:hypothetical protein